MSMRGKYPPALGAVSFLAVVAIGCGSNGSSADAGPPVANEIGDAAAGDRAATLAADTGASTPDPAASRDAAPGPAPGTSPDARSAADLISPPVDVPSDGPSPGMASVVRGDPPRDVPDGGAPFLLSQTGLFADIERKIIASDVLEFEPEHKLWSDAADKRRWVVLPAGSKIDTRDMDHWEFPIGTRFWKEFSREGKRLETRLIQRTGPAPGDYFMGAFQWDAAERDAVFVPSGNSNVLGTDHDVPEAKKCWTCHKGDQGRILGFSAIQLSKPPGTPGPTLASLAASSWLSHPPAAGVSYPAPGNGAIQAALGYLHANCGHCHNDNGEARSETDIMLRLEVAERTPEATRLYRSSIGIPTQKFRTSSAGVRVVPGMPDLSAITFRMSRREKETMMPPLATKHVDMVGLEVVRRWILELPPKP